MTPKKLASHYLRFWDVAANVAHLADNAPAEFWKFVLTLPKTTDRQVIYEALKSVASPNDQIDVPSVSSLLQWVVSQPQAVDMADALLSGKAPPKSLSTLLRNTYLAEIQAARGLVRTFLQTEIAKY